LPVDEPTTFHSTTEHWLYRSHEVEVEIFDTAGQRAFETLRGLAYHGANIFILSYDVGNEASLENVVNKWIPEAVTSPFTAPGITAVACLSLPLWLAFELLLSGVLVSYRFVRSLVPVLIFR